MGGGCVHSGQCGVGYYTFNLDVIYRTIVNRADDVDETETGRADDEGPGAEDERNADRADESEGLKHR